MNIQNINNFFFLKNVVVGNGIAYTMLTVSRTIFLAALGLCCCLWTFSSCGKQGLLSTWGVQASCCGGLSCCRAWGSLKKSMLFGEEHAEFGARN